jgi:chromosome segregation ATPase
MWGLLEKGKELAANIDKQLNESVGVDGAPPASGNLNDAWNDDDFGEDFEDGPQQEPSRELLVANDTNGWKQEGVTFEDNQLPDQEAAPADIFPVESTISPIKEVASPDTVGKNPAAPAELVDESAIESEIMEEIPISPYAKEKVGRPPEDALEEAEPIEPDDPQALIGNPEPPESKVKENDEVVPVTGTSPEPTSSKEDSPVVVENHDARWEDDLYDDEDEEEDDDEKERNATAKSAAKETVTSPPATITIPSAIQDSSNNQQEIQELQSQVEQLTAQLQQREQQLTQKAEQMASMEQMHEAEKEDLRNKIIQTKEEAKKRIQKAKERVEAMESSMGGGKEDLVAKEETINALREEGQKLAKKQSEMEKAVRSAKAETRELSAVLEEETSKKEKALEKISNLETELKKIKDELASARRGESQATKLENDLVQLKEEADRKEAANLSLQQQVKELKAESKELRKEMETAQKGALLESRRESTKLKKEHEDVLSELEVKLRTVERDASIREDALRQEVDELRKRWQDAVRRADSLSLDVQNSTAPLLRQLESMERQNRARAAGWAELETKLRSDLEDYVITNEKLTKERNEYRATHSRLTRINKEFEEELSVCKNTVEDQKIKIEKQQAHIEEMETEGKKMKEEWSEVERLANEGVSKVRSDMMKTVMESEERHQAQLKSLENELQEERKKRNLLERQVEELLENAGMAVVPTPTNSNAPVIPNSIVKKLRASEGQADILAGALSGLAEEDENNARDDDDEISDAQQVGTSSFAAMEQLSQRLKASKVELEALRSSLASAERARESLVEELSDARVAKEKLPLFEAKVQELAKENHEKELEIIALREDISEIRQLYRGQLNALIEEKAANMSEVSERLEDTIQEEEDSVDRELPATAPRSLAPDPGDSADSPRVMPPAEPSKLD